MPNPPTPGPEILDELRSLRARIPELERERDQRRQAEEWSRQREQHLRLQNKVLVELSHSSTIARGERPGAFREITSAAAHTIQVERVGIWLFDEGRQRIECVDLYELSPDRHSAGLTLEAAGHPRYFMALEEHRALSADDACADPRTSEFAEFYLRPHGITSMLDSPVLVEGRLAGIICHEHVGPQREWAPEEVAFAGSMADFAARTLQSAERRRTETALRESEEQHRQLVQSLQAIVWRCDPDTMRFTFVSEEAESILGYPVEAWLAKPSFWVDCLHPEDRAWVPDYCVRATAQHRPHQLEYRMVAADGRVVWLRNIVNVLVEDGKVTESLGVMIDITLRKQAEHELEKQRAFLRQVLDINPSIIFAKDRAGRFTLVNQALADAYTTTIDDLIGKTDADYNPNTKEVEHFRHDDLAVMDSQQELVIPEEIITGASGLRRWLRTIKRPIIGMDGVAHQVLGVAHDITELKETEQHLLLTVRELDHRVKNNLAAVLSIADQTAATTDNFDEFMPKFTGRVKSMAIAHEMLARTKWEGAEIRDMVARIVEPYRRLGGERFVIEGESLLLPPDVAPCLCMILHELSANAAKYGALSVPTGRISLHWRLLDASDPETPVLRRPARRLLRLEWEEADGPAVEPPRRRGFGMELIEHVVAYQLHGEADLSFDETGVRYAMMMPLLHVDDDGDGLDDHDGGSMTGERDDTV